MRFALLGIMFGSILVFSVSHAQQPSPSLSELERAFLSGAETAGTPTEISKEERTNYANYKMEEESNRRLLALCVMGTAVLSLLLVLAYLYRRQAPPDIIVNGSGLVLVIFATVLVAILAKSDQQLTAPIGILGAIAGYLFGKTTKGTDAEPKPEKVTSN